VDICDVLLDRKHLQRDTKISGGASFGAFGLKAEAKIDGTHKLVRPDKIGSINQAAALIGECVQQRGANKSVLIIDELDRVTSSGFRNQLSELIKRIHDTRIGLKLIMCGIGKTLEEIIGNHLSASRAIAPYELSPISFDARWKIIEQAAEKLDVVVDREFLIRISQISDGFPYYVHLIAECLFWQIFDHRESSVKASSADFHVAVSKAVERAESPLRDAYNAATQKTKNSIDYEECLWSVAEGAHFERQILEIYPRSYIPIMESRMERKAKALTIDKFRQRLYRLCEPSHGSILVKKRNSWYAFNENVIRGYVRLVAERAGVKLGADSLA
jgi:uncharacterized protein